MATAEMILTGLKIEDIIGIQCNKERNRFWWQLT